MRVAQHGGISTARRGQPPFGLLHRFLAGIALAATEASLPALAAALPHRLSDANDGLTDARVYQAQVCYSPVLPVCTARLMRPCCSSPLREHSRSDHLRCDPRSDLRCDLRSDRCCAASRFSRRSLRQQCVRIQRCAAGASWSSSTLSCTF